jgi:hypothetical protein
VGSGLECNRSGFNTSGSSGTPAVCILCFCSACSPVRMTRRGSRCCCSTETVSTDGDLGWREPRKDRITVCGNATSSLASSEAATGAETQSNIVARPQGPASSARKEEIPGTGTKASASDATRTRAAATRITHLNAAEMASHGVVPFVRSLLGASPRLPERVPVSCRYHPKRSGPRAGKPF